tara:strand:- start:124 stop:399 length:276 start_codon:yes stop_codon:yes gene_type:complete
MANHSLGMLIAIMDDENGPEYKINFIKTIRTKWGLGLKAAKEVAEAALLFRENVIEAVEVNRDKIVDNGNKPVEYNKYITVPDGKMYVEEK